MSEVKRLRTDVLSVGFDNVTLQEAVELAFDHIVRGKKCRVVTPNAEIGLDCLKNDRLREVVNASELVLPDGVGVIHAARILGRSLKAKVPGIEFAEALADRMQHTGKRLFLFGSKPGVAEAAEAKLQARYPGLEIAGTLNGYFSDEAAVVRTINEAAPDALFVCLGSPKQEFFMADHRDELTCALTAGLGGSLDVFSGSVQRAPKAFQDLGLEWLYRLIKEPKRYKRMARLPLYLIYAERQKRREKKHA